MPGEELGLVARSPEMSTSSLLEPEHVTFCGKKREKKKKYLADVMKLRKVGWGDDPGLSWWSQI